MCVEPRNNSSHKGIMGRRLDMYMSYRPLRFGLVSLIRTQLHCMTDKINLMTDSSWSDRASEENQG